jgi:Ca2+/Na+ antiporter
VSFASDAYLDRKSFLRDTIFYLFGVVGVIIIVHDGQVHLFESIIFLGYYFT